MLEKYLIGVERVSAIFAVLSGVLLVAISLLTGIDVVTSTFWNSPIPGTIEISILALPWIICGGLAYALVRNIHVRVTLFTDRLHHHNAKRINDFIINLGGVLFCTFLTIGGWLHFWSSWIIKEPMFAALLTLPAWLGKLAVPAGFFLLGLNFLIKLIVPRA